MTRLLGGVRKDDHLSLRRICKFIEARLETERNKAEVGFYHPVLVVKKPEGKTSQGFKGRKGTEGLNRERGGEGD